MSSTVHRQTVDLSSFPDLVVIYLGMRVNAWTGVKALLGLGPPQIQASPMNQKLQLRRADTNRHYGASGLRS
jgi:hypothetical protein